MTPIGKQQGLKKTYLESQVIENILRLVMDVEPVPQACAVRV